MHASPTFSLRPRFVPKSLSSNNLRMFVSSFRYASYAFYASRPSVETPDPLTLTHSPLISSVAQNGSLRGSVLFTCKLCAKLFSRRWSERLPATALRPLPMASRKPQLNRPAAVARHCLTHLSREATSLRCRQKSSECRSRAGQLLLGEWSRIHTKPLDMSAATYPLLSRQPRSAYGA
jgi:hypothetical protein